MENRKKAISWWNQLNTEAKELFVERFYSRRKVSSLTGREIENILTQVVKIHNSI